MSRVVQWPPARRLQELPKRPPWFCRINPNGTSFESNLLPAFRSAWRILSETSTPHQAAESVGRRRSWRCAPSARLERKIIFGLLPVFFTCSQSGCVPRRKYSRPQGGSRLLASSQKKGG